MSSINGACEKPYHNWYLAGDTWRCHWCEITKQAENDLGKLPMVNTLGMTAEQLIERAEAYEAEAAHLRRKALYIDDNAKPQESW